MVDPGSTREGKPGEKADAGVPREAPPTRSFLKRRRGCLLLIAVFYLLCSLGSRREYCTVCGQERDVTCLYPLTRFQGGLDLSKHPAYDTPFSVALREAGAVGGHQHAWSQLDIDVFPLDMIMRLSSLDIDTTEFDEMLHSAGVAADLRTIARSDPELAVAVVHDLLRPRRDAAQFRAAIERFESIPMSSVAHDKELRRKLRSEWGLPETTNGPGNGKAAEPGSTR
jgi:hypothetical protein